MNNEISYYMKRIAQNSFAKCQQNITAQAGNIYLPTDFQQVQFFSLRKSSGADYVLWKYYFKTFLKCQSAHLTKDYPLTSFRFRFFSLCVDLMFMLDCHNDKLPSLLALVEMFVFTQAGWLLYYHFDRISSSAVSGIYSRSFFWCLKSLLFDWGEGETTFQFRNRRNLGTLWKI